MNLKRDFENHRSEGNPVLNTRNNNDNCSSGNYQWFLNPLPNQARAAALAEEPLSQDNPQKESYTLEQFFVIIIVALFYTTLAPNFSLTKYSWAGPRPVIGNQILHIDVVPIFQNVWLRSL